MTRRRWCRPVRGILLAVSVLAAVAVAASIWLLVSEIADARRRLPAEQEALASLEEAVREDAAVAATLTAEYERQRDATLERRDRFGLYTASLIAAAIVMLVAAKSWAWLGGDESPSVGEISRHRGDHAKRPCSRRRRKKADAREDDKGTTPADPATIDLAFVDRVIEEEGRSAEAAIPILQRIQEHYRYLPDEALGRVCELTEIEPAQIAGVSSFYARFRRSPAGRWIVRVCHGTACHVSGATQITEEIRRSLGIDDAADTDPRRDFTVDEVACLGCCSLAPVMTIEGETVARLTPADARDAVEDWREEHDE